ncbi:MAG: hypothetical protein MUC38_06615 [Cyclobacteriaceae bacterium]|jgi:hypothetical protein|nr:hypothetical protein [Cyclobacteriaceae bacterium]
MKLPILLLVSLVVCEGRAQTAVQRSVPVKPGQAIQMHFDYPQQIRITTWDKSDLEITGRVTINGGENDDAFELETTREDTRVLVSSRIKNFTQLPQRMTLSQGGQKVQFKSREALREYVREHGNEYDFQSWGVDMDIALEIKVPRGVRTQITSVYGMVEVVDFAAPLAVDATYGGVDASIREAATGELTAETDYGQIFSNLSTQFESGNIREENPHTEVTARPGKGVTYRFESKYGNVYLRKIG